MDGDRFSVLCLLVLFVSVALVSTALAHQPELSIPATITARPGMPTSAVRNNKPNKLRSRYLCGEQSDCPPGGCDRWTASPECIAQRPGVQLHNLRRRDVDLEEGGDVAARRHGHALEKQRRVEQCGSLWQHRGASTSRSTSSRRAARAVPCFP